ncbi:NACHT domain-containing protein [Actinomadura sp. 9N215]|uniref:NACHT domain-containing protein n=1 Tax=Actinomadura sp. 9N215 TaxID=3375150 RepID=UPI003792173B
MGRTLLGASLLVAAGVAVNQILNNGKLSWNWGYLALAFTVLGGLLQAAPQPATPAAETTTPPMRRPWRARHTYLRRMRSSVDQMETIGLVTQAEFVLRTRQVYVDVMLQPKPVTDTVTDTGIGAVPSAPGQRDSLASFLTPGRVLAVLGAAGSGKTTLARYTALELAEKRWRRRLLPVLLYLRDQAEAIRTGEPENLAPIAAAAPWLGGAIPAEWLERRLARGQCVVLLDGLDEVADADDRRRVVRWVEDQISRYPGNTFVVTSRPLGYKDNRLSSADVLQVQRFTSGQIRAFLHAWYRAIEHRSRQGDAQEIDRIAARDADDLFQRISGRPALYDLAANPMLLTMIANVHRYRAGSLPRSRASLYEEMCQVLLHRRQEAKNLRDTDLEGLSGERKERIIQELAWHMMRNHLRDIPVAQAERAIRDVLQRTAPNLTPEAFLSHVRRSGLLLEHQHGQYSFAHLTLQEYLAAALVPGHASRRQVLVENVGDPWWRETTLLWAARADASPVVEACLAARTVATLNLAYACASEARELDPVLRADLDRLLNTTHSDPAEVRLLNGVAATRALQDTRALDNSGTRICAHPVPDNLWTRYFRAHAHPGFVDRFADLESFLIWLNSLVSDGISYRLPTAEEAQQALGSDLYPDPGTILYATDHDRDSAPNEVRLILGESARHPHEPAPEQIEAHPELILRQTRLVCRLLGSRSGLPFTHLLSYASPRDLRNPRHQLLHVIDLAFELACKLAHCRRRLRKGELGFYSGPSWDPVRIFDMFHARKLASDLNDALGIVRTVEQALTAVFRYGLDQEFVGVRADSSTLNRVLSQAIVEVLHLAPHRDLFSDQQLASAVNEAHELADAFAGPQGHDNDPDHIDALNAVLRDLIAHDAAARNLNGNLDIDLDRSRSIDEISHLGAAHFRFDSRSSNIASYFHFASAHTREHAAYLQSLDVDTTAHITAVAGTFALGNGLALAGDLALARLMATSDVWAQGVHAVTGLAGACDQLVRHHMEISTPERTYRSRQTDRVPTSFGDFLREQLSNLRPWHLTDDPVMAIERARRRANVSGMRDLEALITTALLYSSPLWERSRPVRQSDTVLAATCVLAALTLCDEGSTDLVLPELLRGALWALVALTPDTGGQAERAKLVLVRD